MARQARSGRRRKFSPSWQQGEGICGQDRRTPGVHGKRFYTTNTSRRHPRAQAAPARSRKSVHRLQGKVRRRCHSLITISNS